MIENGKNGAKAPSADEVAKARLSRNGASLAFVELSHKFGSRLLDVVPKMWQSMAGGLLSACSGGKFCPSRHTSSLTSRVDSTREMDALIETQYGQDVIDSLSVLEAVVPTFHEDLWPKLADLLPTILLALRSRFAIIRQCSARCFATICGVMTIDAMHFVIKNVVPYLGDSSILSNRQGATELIYRK